MEAMTFLDKAAKSKRQQVYVLSGDEDFLKRRALAAIQALVLGETDPSFALSSYSGDKADYAEVRSELDTLPFLADCRLVVIEQADPFVTKYRQTLEKYVTEPAQSGVLVLDVKSWTSTTNLAKKVPDAGTIVCRAARGTGRPANGRARFRIEQARGLFRRPAGH
jgi:DNA polymerase-3 subunit delta